MKTKISIVMAFALLLTVLLNLPTTVSAEESGWIIQIVDPQSYGGRYNSMALDSSGYPHISYYDDLYGNLKYAKLTEGGWITQIADPSVDVGKWSSMALDSNDRPHISYYDSWYGNLKYAKLTVSGWITQTVDAEGDIGSCSSIALDSSGYPHITYCEYPWGDLRYARWDGSGWSIEAVESGEYGFSYTSIALDSNDRPHISYYDDSGWDLKYAKFTEAGWSIQTADSSANVGRWSSITLDSNDRPHISYYDYTYERLRYAKLTVSGWITQTVDDDGDVGQYTSIALDSSGYPHITYYDATFGHKGLKYAKLTETGWIIDTVDGHASRNVGRYTSIALDSSDRPHISYHEDEPEFPAPGKPNLKYATIALERPEMSWIHQFGTDSMDNAVDVCVDSTGIYVSGFTGGTLPGQTNLGGLDAFICKYDFDGNQIWNHQFGTTASDFIYGMSVDTSGIYVVGGTYGQLPGQTSSGSGDAFISKYDLDGNHLWTRQFGSPAYEFAYNVFAHDSGVYVCGSTQGELPSQSSVGGWDAFVCRYDADGNLQWTRQFGTIGDDYGNAVSVDDGVYVSGRTDGSFPSQVSAGSFDLFVRKYSLDGTESWTRQYGSSGEDRTYDSAIDSTGVYIVGYAVEALPGQTAFGVEDAFICKYDVDGNLQWTHQFGTAEFDAASEISAYSGSLYIAGTTAGSLPEQHSSGDLDAFMCKYDDAGNQKYTYQFGTVAMDLLLGIDVNGQGIAVAGYTLGDLPGNTNLGSHDAFVRFMPFNTPTGPHVGVVDQETGITVTFTGISEEGSTVVEDSNAGPSMPGGFDFLGTYFDITTTAGYAGDIIIAIPYDETLLVDNGVPFEELLEIRQWDANLGQWVDVTDYVDTVNNIVYARVTRLSIFTCMYPKPEPSITEISGPTEPVPVNTEISVDASFTNPLVMDTHTAEWNWGDGSTSDGTIIDYTVTGSHFYTVPGVFTITLTVTDDDGASDTEVYRYAVIHHPDVGFVTGGGWINSPEGAYTPDPSLTGKATFGFVSKYKKGASTPTGKTEFIFHVADLNFHSTSYQWLVVAGPQAKFKGTGTINGQGDYGFMLTAIDGQIHGGGGVDKFRIKIWDKISGTVIYDNQPDDADDAEATTPIGGGSIVIHVK